MIKRLTVAALVAIAMGCGSKSSPTAPGAVSKPGGSLRFVAITGPAIVAPGTVTPLTLMATYGDSSKVDLTSQALWTASNPDVLSVDGGGRAVAIQDGVAGVAAQFSGLSATLVLTVLEAGTVILQGTVIDSGFALSGARVEVISGTGAGKATTTDANGHYKLFGVAGSIDVRASLDGYQSQTRSMTVSSSQPTLTFTLVPTTTQADLAGDWDLTFEASASCTTLVDVARRRTYIATLVQTGSALTVTLAGGQFAIDPSFYGPQGFENQFRAHVLGNAVALTLATYAYYGTHYDLAEIIPQNGVFTIVGKGTGTATSSTISGTLDGIFTLTGSGGGSNSPPPTSSVCNAADHRFSFVRRLVTSRR
jgi:Carboxypeptidase regulatory-like domain